MDVASAAAAAAAAAQPAQSICPGKMPISEVRSIIEPVNIDPGPLNSSIRKSGPLYSYNMLVSTLTEDICVVLVSDELPLQALLLRADEIKQCVQCSAVQCVQCSVCSAVTAES